MISSLRMTKATERILIRISPEQLRKLNKLAEVSMKPRVVLIREAIDSLFKVAISK